MDKLLIEATNLHTLACFLIERIENEQLKLSDILHQLEGGNHGALLYCSLKQIFMDTHCEILKAIESIETLMCNSSLDKDMRTALDSIKKELQTLRESCAELEETFTPYLFCPALNPPEHQN